MISSINRDWANDEFGMMISSLVIKHSSLAHLEGSLWAWIYVLERKGIICLLAITMSIVVTCSVMMFDVVRV
jgi:hypothetical protein